MSESNVETLADADIQLHRDGTVTYWSVYEQRWCRFADVVFDRELAAMSAEIRERVQRHLARREAHEDAAVERERA